jgi:hypothetical protein
LKQFQMHETFAEAALDEYQTLLTGRLQLKQFIAFCQYNLSLC